MKRTIPFDLFGEKQNLCFTITGISQLEMAMGKSIQQILRTGDAGVSFCLAALPIALRKISAKICKDKIEEYIENGGSIDELATPVVHAIAISGIIGKEAANNVMAIYYPELVEPEDEKTKNA